MTEANDGTPIPQPEGDEVWDEIEAKEDESEETVEVSKQELEELGDFLGAIQQLIMAHERRISTIEQFLAEVTGAANEVDSDTSEGTSEEVPDGGFKPTIVDGSGKPLDAGGTDVPEQNS